MRSISSASPPAVGKISTGVPKCPQRARVIGCCSRSENQRSVTFIVMSAPAVECQQGNRTGQTRHSAGQGWHRPGLSVLDRDPDALVALALRLGAGHPDPADVGRAHDVGAAVGLLVEADDVDHPQRVDLARDQVGRGPDQGRVGIREVTAEELDDDVVRGGDLLVDPALDTGDPSSTEIASSGKSSRPTPTSMFPPVTGIRNSFQMTPQRMCSAVWVLITCVSALPVELAVHLVRRRPAARASPVTQCQMPPLSRLARSTSRASERGRQSARVARLSAAAGEERRTGQQHPAGRLGRRRARRRRSSRGRRRRRTARARSGRRARWRGCRAYRAQPWCDHATPAPWEQPGGMRSAMRGAPCIAS